MDHVSYLFCLDSSAPNLQPGPVGWLQCPERFESPAALDALVRTYRWATTWSTSEPATWPFNGGLVPFFFDKLGYQKKRHPKKNEHHIITNSWNHTHSISMEKISDYKHDQKNLKCLGWTRLECVQSWKMPVVMVFQISTLDDTNFILQHGSHVSYVYIYCVLCTHYNLYVYCCDTMNVQFFKAVPWDPWNMKHSWSSRATKALQSGKEKGNI